MSPDLAGRKEQAAAGFEPANNGFANHQHKSINPAKSNTCNIEKSDCPVDCPALLDKVQDAALPLQTLVQIWPELPKHIKAAVKALIETFMEFNENDEVSKE